MSGARRFAAIAGSSAVVVIAGASALLLPPQASRSLGPSTLTPTTAAPSPTYTPAPITATATLPTHPMPTSTTDDAYNDFADRIGSGMPVLRRVGETDPGLLEFAQDNRLRAFVVIRKTSIPMPDYPSTLHGLPVIIRPSLLTDRERDETMTAFVRAGWEQKVFAPLGVTVLAVVSSTDGGPIGVSVDVVTPESRRLADELAPHGPASYQFIEPVRVTNLQGTSRGSTEMTRR
jgi:hypothetical protein